MCLIIFKPKGINIPKSIIADAWRSNRDGAGFFVPSGQRFYFEKGFFSASSLISALKKFEGLDVVIHLRAATHGKATGPNCHPFVISREKDSRLKGLANSVFCHNGILNEYGDNNNSDSWHFAREVLAPLSRPARLRVLDTVNGRFAIGDRGQINLFGLSEHLPSGCLVSNFHWDHSRIVVAPGAHQQNGVNDDKSLTYGMGAYKNSYWENWDK